MLYKIAHFLRDRMGWLWTFVEWVNSLLFVGRYGKRLKSVSFSMVPQDYEVVALSNVPTEKMVAFFERQPEEAFTYFKPHGFDAQSIRRLQRNRAFMAYVLLEKASGAIAGYCFNRCFFHGVGYRGRMVDISFRGRGLGTLMNKLLNEAGFGIGLRLFESVSRDNVASYRAALSASKVRVLQELPDNELYLEILPE
jgi:RimJ/RimL family protein N-acetyltransferase